MVNTTLREYLQITEDNISSGRIDDAMANCQHILSYFPDSLEAQRLLGEVYLAQGQLEEAQQTFDWILVNDPENVIAYCDRALTSERLSDIDTALDCYQQAYELSRGNSQIRQKFNQLSAKVGQQEFMFSRAGLARLYMRGDLLTQAVQEWEAVLNASPERLDARTGLLETYWREGTYDKVEQMATQILEEIPTCLKALLLLAHVTSTSNLERAKELILRAEVLDPELVMAQELFSDLFASQPNNPFLALLKKKPIISTDLTDKKYVSKIQTAISVAVESNGSQSSAESKDPPHSFSNLETWSELDTKQTPLNVIKPMEEASAFASWSDATTIQNSNAWSSNDLISHSEPGFDIEKSSPELGDDFDPTILEQQPWFQAEQLLTTTTEPENASEDQSSIGSVETMHSWSTVTQENDFPTPPAWLDVLTKIDRQTGDPLSTTSNQSSDIQEPLENAVLTQSQAELELAAPKLWEEDFSPIPASLIQEESAFFFSKEDNNSDMEMEWPEWLKSLGAETLEPDPGPGVAPETPEYQQSLAFPEWALQIDQKFSETEVEKISALEHLENDLRSQGFVPLQPGTLSTLVEEPSLSSALAELGNFTVQPATPEPPGVQSQPVSFMQSAEATAPAEITSPLTILAGNTQSGERGPSWLDALNQSSEMPASPVSEQSINASSTISPASLTQETFRAEATQEVVRAEAANQIFEPVTNSVTNISQETPLTSTYRADALLENELETTMKRPAVRLQSMHQLAAHPDTSSMLGKGHAGELGKAQENNLSNKERLLRGYQFQLAGAYDDAMQQYRIIIRHAPELLSEVISNVRALLKLTPRYLAGYRVLGDAYMRQGEYLQAMEAYNKALTIAKKAKSQSI